jgi:DNA-binding beta-propeller fold protein YncE
MTTSRHAVRTLGAGFSTLLALSGWVQAQTGFANFETPPVHPIALSPGGTRLLVANTADNRVEVFDVASGQPVWLRSIAVGMDPVSVRWRSENEAWVVNHLSDSISIVDMTPTLTGMRVVRTIPAGDEPADVVFAGSPARAFVSVSQLNQVRVFDPASPGTAPTIIAIEGEDPRALAVSPDGTRVYAAIFESGNNTTIVNQANVSNPGGPYAGVNPPPNSGTLFDPPRTPGLPAAPPVGQIVRWSGTQWLDDNGRNWTSLTPQRLHDHDVAIINTSTLGVTYASGMLTTVMNLAVAPDGTVTAVGTEAINQVRFEPNLTGVFVRAQMGHFSPASPASVSRIDLNPHLDYAVTNIPAEEREQSVGDPRAAAYLPDGSGLYVAGMGSNNVILTAPSGERLARIDVGEGPAGMALSADGSTLYVLNRFDGSISVIDTAKNVETWRTDFFDPTPDTIKLGRPMLYNTHLTSGLGQVACASCHVDGRTDHLGWDLGNPAGEMKDFNQDCRQPTCRDWHPMKGPMVTQTLQGIVGNGPMHWRGDRENLAAFSPAFTGLQGLEAEPDELALARFEAFVATIRHGPNPLRNLDGTLSTSVATSTGIGDAVAGLNVYTTVPTLPGGLRCVTCHTLPTGTDQTIDDPPGAPPQQGFKVAQLRNMFDKAGANFASINGARGFGFNHDGDRPTLQAVLGPPFQFAPGPAGQTQRRNLEAFMLSLSTDTHAAVGRQITFDGTNNTDPALVAQLTTLVNLANSGTIGLVAKARREGFDRGYSFESGLMRPDRASELSLGIDLLRLSSAAGSETTFMAVVGGTQRRIGLDRDADGAFDRDELDSGANPADPASRPGVCTADIDRNGVINSTDVSTFINLWFDDQADAGLRADFNHDNISNSTDVSDLINAFFGQQGQNC